MKVKSDHPSIFSNLSNWKEEAWKNQGFNGIQAHDLCDTGAMLYQLSYEVTHSCIRLAGGKFKLSNQDSAGGKKFTVLTLIVSDRKGVEIRQLFSLGMAWNIHGLGIYNSQNHITLQKSEKYETFCVVVPIGESSFKMTRGGSENF